MRFILTAIPLCQTSVRCSRAFLVLIGASSMAAVFHLDVLISPDRFVTKVLQTKGRHNHNSLLRIPTKTLIIPHLVTYPQTHFVMMQNRGKAMVYHPDDSSSKGRFGTVRKWIFQTEVGIRRATPLNV